MNLKLRALDRDEALALCPLFEAWAADHIAAFRDAPPPDGFGRSFVEQRFERPETLFLVAEAEGETDPVALCVTGPFEDPLTLEVGAMIVTLHVDSSIRHRGVARNLVKEARRLLDARGGGTLSARAGHNDDALISMGERWGFIRSWEVMVDE